MGAKSEALAKQFEAKVNEATKVIEGLSEADWKKAARQDIRRVPASVAAYHQVLR